MCTWLQKVCIEVNDLVVKEHNLVNFFENQVSDEIHTLSGEACVKNRAFSVDIGCDSSISI